MQRDEIIVQMRLSTKPKLHEILAQARHPDSNSRKVCATLGWLTPQGELFDEIGISLVIEKPINHGVAQSMNW